METTLSAIVKWQRDIGNTGEFRHDESVVKHIGYLCEEVAELLEAVGHGDEAETVSKIAESFKALQIKSGTLPLSREKVIACLDGFADVLWFSVAGMLRCGACPYEVLERVQESNDSKRLPDGKFKRDLHGKILKPEGYFPPDFSGLTLSKQIGESSDRVG
jgi:predicted HAD superfamily Cof-like phosphohydrolase